MTSLYREFATQAQIDARYNPSLKLADPTSKRAGKKTVACPQTRSRRRCWSAASTTLHRCATVIFSR